MIERIATQPDHRADPRRERHRQGAGRARDPRRVAAARAPVRRDQLRRDPGDAARERAVRPRARRVHRCGARQARAVRGGRRRDAVPRRGRRAAARRCRPSCCARCRRARSGGSATPRRSRSTSGWSRRRCATSRARSRRAGSARTSTTGSTSCPCAIPPLRERARGHPAARAVLRSRATPRATTAARSRCRTRRSRRCADQPWPGNVRELENVIERALVLADGPAIDAAVPDHRDDRASGAGRRGRGRPRPCRSRRRPASSRQELIRRALGVTQGNRTNAAKLLEISHRALLYKIKEYGIS